MKIHALVTRTRMEFLEEAEMLAQVPKMRFEMGLDRLRTPNEQFIWVRRLDHMRGLRPYSIHFKGRWVDLEEAQEIRDYTCALVGMFPEIQVGVG